MRNVNQIKMKYIVVHRTPGKILCKTFMNIPVADNTLIVLCTQIKYDACMFEIKSR